MEERRHYDKVRQRDMRRITAAFVILAVGTILAIWLTVRNNTAQTNAAVRNRNERIAQIQAARVESCRRTYEGVRQIFQPFLHPDGDPRRNRDIRQFNQRIDSLKNGCGRQTGVKP